MWLYVFGSLVRGEIDFHSDFDFIGIQNENENVEAPSSIQIYSLTALKEIHEKGDLFAHHLFQESVLVHSPNGSDIINELGKPSIYEDWKKDFESFTQVALYALSEIANENDSVFSRGLLYMSIRDLAMIYSHVILGKSNFSKYTPYQIDIPFQIKKCHYDQLRASRLSSTRGTWSPSLLRQLPNSCSLIIKNWVAAINEKAISHVGKN